MNIGLADIEKAATRISPYIHHTPVFTSHLINELVDAHLFFKCENFQKAGAFKFRGATNAVFSLSEAEAQKGVATHSSGNHGAALALAAKIRGIPAYIVMPSTAAAVKKEAVASYGAKITFCEPTLESRVMTLNRIVEETGATFIHPYENKNVIAGQGTVALELLRQCPQLEMIVVPIGGGGLISGIAIASDALSPTTHIIGAEPELADDTFRSFKEGKRLITDKPDGICDGLLMTVGEMTFPIIMKHVFDIYTARETTILTATKYIWERMKLVVEPSAAITLAIILEHPHIFKDRRVGMILSGGNVDFKAIVSLM